MINSKLVLFISSFQKDMEALSSDTWFENQENKEKARTRLSAINTLLDELKGEEKNKFINENKEIIIKFLNKLNLVARFSEESAILIHKLLEHLGDSFFQEVNEQLYQKLKEKMPKSLAIHTSLKEIISAAAERTFKNIEEGVISGLSEDLADLIEQLNRNSTYKIILEIFKKITELLAQVEDLEDLDDKYKENIDGALGALEDVDITNLTRKQLDSIIEKIEALSKKTGQNFILLKEKFEYKKPKPKPKPKPTYPEEDSVYMKRLKDTDNQENAKRVMLYSKLAKLTPKPEQKTQDKDLEEFKKFLNELYQDKKSNKNKKDFINLWIAKIDSLETKQTTLEKIKEGLKLAIKEWEFQGKSISKVKAGVFSHRLKDLIEAIKDRDKNKKVGCLPNFFICWPYKNTREALDNLIKELGKKEEKERNIDMHLATLKKEFGIKKKG